ncbi:MAG: zinc-dependent metalloprotease, partial [Gemmatimonadaceae bacterium]|nr:zinc-dependent metalloprotease [Gemmatimonadaceae bacterium]MCU0636661.1 zinc-dependent metalloprotease [Gemmatimonadaceae bacterium]
ADDDNGSWSTMLREVDALRVVEAMPTMYYHGIVRLTYGSGIAGVAFRPGRAGLSYDVLGNGGAPLVVAHELGHNFNRDHAPCGVTGDREFPHVNGAIGVVGLNLSTLQIFAPTRPDLMSYCSNGWVSDWNWTQILRYRATADAVAGSQMAATTAEAPARQRVLLVWGHADERAVHLEPAFALEGMPTAPQPGGTFHVEGRDATGAVLFSQAFAAQEIPDLPAKPESHFALAVPLPATIESRLASLTVVRARDGRAATMRTSATGAQANIVSTVEVARAAGGTLAVRHDRAAARMALVRDAASGQILGFVRNGDAALQAPRGDVEVLLSDGVRTRRAQVRPALR